MQTVLDVDEGLLNLAERQARRDGKSLGSLVEADDAFSTALEEIRALGRVPALHRQQVSAR
ncbi:MAG: hypothetical protein WCQ21_15460 [Verrucomicrobiota bacterium]